jgi:tyrosyl-tRNA synthetase
MLSKDSVRSRLDRSDGGLSYTEFSYMLLQAYDFVHLYDEYGCRLQAGGSDQWGNITAGIDLARRLRGVQLYGCTCPLLTRSDGGKMGKTESGALWLSPQRTSPYQFLQYWINLDDADVGRCLRYFTDLGKEEIDAVLAEHQADPGRRVAQRRLAAELTDLVHGKSERENAEKASRAIFGSGGLKGGGSVDVYASIAKDVPRNVLLREGWRVIDALVESRLCKTKSVARRTIEQGGAYVNERRVEDVERRLTTADIDEKSLIILRSGKKSNAVLRFV